MEIYQLNPVTPHARYISKAVDLLKNGGLIVYPTDVNYGLGCLLSSAAGVKRLNELTKDLGRNKLHTIICRDFSEISKYARVGNDTFRLIKKTMPGPYTMILEATTLVPKACHTRRSTVGVRMIDRPVMNALFEQIDSPLLNFTALPTNNARIMEDLEEIETLYSNSVDAILSIGSFLTRHTTIIDLTGPKPELVRQGEGDTSTILI
jgi:tRNA threonylcarbamoyl adenosine modification protein (Sua5/YciO/YrdC/YwlC family)